METLKPTECSIPAATNFNGPLRVMMVVPKYPPPVAGGLERQAHELARALTARGHVVHALSGRFHAGQTSRSAVDGVIVHRLPWSEVKAVRFLLAPFTVCRTLWRMRREMDVVHVHNISWFGAFASLVAGFLGLAVMTKLPNTGEFGIPGLQKRALGNLRIWLLKRSDAIVAMAPQSIDELSRIGYPSERIFRVTNGIEVTATTWAKREDDRVRVIFAGRLSPEKGLDVLLHAWKEVCPRASRRVELHLLGEGPSEYELRDLAGTLGVDSSVVFRGYSDEVARELPRSDIFVLPSRAEGNSNAILEAMRAGLPIVATRVGGTAIQVGSEGARFLVEPEDRSGLADRILTLVEGEDLRRATGAAMRARVEAHFDIGRIAESYEQAYTLILSGQRARVGHINRALFDQAQGDGS